jgi:hypothetical protein
MAQSDSEPATNILIPRPTPVHAHNSQPGQDSLSNYAIPPTSIPLAVPTLVLPPTVQLSAISSVLSPTVDHSSIRITSRTGREFSSGTQLAKGFCPSVLYTLRVGPATNLSSHFNLKPPFSLFSLLSFSVFSSSVSSRAFSTRHSFRYISVNQT